MRSAQTREEAGIELAAASAAVVVTAMAAAAMFGPSEPVARAVVVAIGAGTAARWIADPVALIAATTVSCLVYTGFLVHQFGELTGGPVPWRGIGLIAVAVVVGRGLRLCTRGTTSAAVVEAPDGHRGVTVR